MNPKSTSYTLPILGLVLTAGLAVAAPTEPPSGATQAVHPHSECCAIQLGAGSSGQTQNIQVEGISPTGISTQVQAPTHETTRTEATEVSFYHDVTVGARILRPGRYRVQHVSSGNSHFIRFTPVGELGAAYRPVEVECTLESAEHTVNRTIPRLRVEDNGLKLVKLYFAGERAAHAF